MTMNPVNHLQPGACRKPAAGLALAAVVAGLAAAPASADEAACRALSAPGLFPATSVTAANWIAADAARKAPAFCELTATVSPVPGSKVGVVYRLPEGWNGRMIGYGGGGWAGNVTLEVALPGLGRGYATAQTDGGHADRNAGAATWAAGNPVAMTDFSHRAVHVTATTGKQVVAKYFGKAAHHNYFQGCSTGGRMAMMEAQRYPEDYDGVIAGAPVYDLRVQTMGMLRNRPFRAPGAAVSPALLKKVNESILAACDADDGVKDGIVTDPRRCAWQPASMACAASTGGSAAAAPDSCLAPAQVKAFEQVYASVRSTGGETASYGLGKGGEGGWMPFVQSTPGELNAMSGALGELIPYMFGRADYDPITQFDPVRDNDAMHRTPFGREYEARNADLSPFLKRGGKLILWHGLHDPGPSPYMTVDYFEQVKAKNGAAAEGVQLYLAPGVYHCRGGPGADDFDLVTAMEEWVENGRKPGVLTARNTRSGIERPLCPYPALPHYKSGDAAAASSFECRVTK
jgi:feruloyl esterase